MNLITAKQANLLVKNTEKYKKQLLADKVSKDISEAAMMGRQGVDIEYLLTPEIKVKLEELGYKLQMNGQVLELSW